MGWRVHLQHDSSISLLAGSLSFLLLVGRSLQLLAMQAFPQNCLSVLRIQLWVSLRASDSGSQCGLSCLALEVTQHPFFSDQMSPRYDLLTYKL